MSSRATLLLLTALLAIPGCEAGGRPGTRDGGGGLDGSPPPGTDAGTAPFRCSPGTSGCDGNVYWECGADGDSRSFETTCERACDPTLRCVECRPGARRCDGTISQACTANGRAWVAGRDCAEWGSACGADGFCTDACADAERTASNVGCEYWPVALANTNELDATTFDYRVVVANPNDATANVRVRRGATDAWTGTVPPGGLVEIPLPWVPGQSFNIPEGRWTSFVTADGAYRLTSDLPVIASQFNPFEYRVGSVNSFTNDATLLYPTHVLTGDYVGVSYPPLSRRRVSSGIGGSSSTARYPGYLAIAATAPGTTRVQFTARGEVAADPGGRWPATRTGGSFAFDLARGEVAHVVAAVPPDCAPGRPGFVEARRCMTVPIFGEQCDLFQTCTEQEYDLTGSRVVADQPVAVFGGHTCAYVPTSATACDHLEVMMPPIQSWGRAYVSAPMADGSLNGTNIVRVLPAFEATTVTISPPQGGVSGGMLSPGQFLELDATTPFTVSGTSAILVAQYLRGQYATDPPAARGDPALTVLVPSEQFRSDYTFVLPSSYNAGTNGQNHVLVIRPPGLAITVDGAPVTASFAAIGGSEIAVLPLEGGTHRMRAEMPFGLIAYGLGSFTSYATPAGLDLEPITILF
ncbi:MAG: IgGFc-binding protein [Sandaracinaceae bacterium]|nr:IgGFc-binding protein [Sandaracinaceae bacterium]